MKRRKEQKCGQHLKTISSTLNDGTNIAKGDDKKGRFPLRKRNTKGHQGKTKYTEEALINMARAQAEDKTIILNQREVIMDLTVLIKSKDYEIKNYHGGGPCTVNKGRERTITKVLYWDRVIGMFGEHNQINGKQRLITGGYFWPHGNMVSENHTIKSCHHGVIIEGHKEGPKRTNQLVGITLGKSWK